MSVCRRCSSVRLNHPKDIDKEQRGQPERTSDTINLNGKASLMKDPLL